ncbi:MAG: hypothetical protein AB7F59_10335 [Bdellovibrionales bacterium]
MRRISYLFALSGLSIATSLAGCSLMQRHESSGYSSWDQEQWNKESSDFSPEPPRSKRQRRPANVENELYVLEKKISTESEYNDYNNFKNNLSDKNRVEYLKQKDKNSRSRWLASVGVSDAHYDATTQNAIEESDIVLGMPKDAVIKSWGEPEEVQVAGNPNYGNERWLYTHFESSTDGFQKQERFIYFEKGRVVGWQTK